MKQKNTPRPNNGQRPGLTRRERRHRRNLVYDWLYYNGHLKSRQRGLKGFDIARLLYRHFPYKEYIKGELPAMSPARMISYIGGIIKSHNLVTPEQTQPLPKAKKESPEHVYFVGDEAKTVVKIGYSRDVVRRCASLQSGCPFPIHIYRVVKNGGPDLERHMHNKYQRYRSHNEWFNVRGELADDLESCDPVPWTSYHSGK